jgi:uncharacterized protein (TIGR00251 family)
MLDNYIKKIKQDGQVYLLCKVIPNSDTTVIKSIDKNNIDGRETEIVTIKIAAVADKNKANKVLISFLAKEFNVLKDNIVIINGKTERLKLIRIKNN